MRRTDGSLLRARAAAAVAPPPVWEIVAAASLPTRVRALTPVLMADICLI
jgi:hypothetical protein